MARTCIATSSEYVYISKHTCTWCFLFLSHMHTLNPDGTTAGESLWYTDKLELTLACTFNFQVLWDYSETNFWVRFVNALLASLNHRIVLLAGILLSKILTLYINLILFHLFTCTFYWHPWMWNNSRWVCSEFSTLFGFVLQWLIIPPCYNLLNPLEQWQGHLYIATSCT